MCLNISQQIGNKTTESEGVTACKNKRTQERTLAAKNM